MKLFLNDEIDPVQWNRLAGAHVFHRYEWRWVIGEVYGLTPCFAMALDGERFALFPGFRVKSRCLSMPFTYLTGFLANSDELCAGIRDALEGDSCSISYKIAEECASESGLITAVIEIDRLDAYLSGLAPKMRNQLRQADKQGFTIEHRRDVEQFYPLYCRKMHEHGTPPHKRAFFEEILRHFGSAAVYTACKDGQPVASMLCIDGEDARQGGRRTRYILWAAAVSEKEVAYANYFVYWSVMREAVEQGIMQIDLGTALYGSTQHDFKKKWRPKIYAVRQIGGAGRHYKESRLMRLASQLWRQIPLGLANAVGPHLRKYLP